MEVFHQYYCEDERGLSNWLRVLLERVLERAARNAGGAAAIAGVTVPSLTLGTRAPHLRRTTPFRTDDVRLRSRREDGGVAHQE